MKCKAPDANGSGFVTPRRSNKMEARKTLQTVREPEMDDDERDEKRQAEEEAYAERKLRDDDIARDLGEL